MKMSTRNLRYFERRWSLQPEEEEEEEEEKEEEKQQQQQNK